MRDAVFTIALLLLTLAGLWSWRIDFVRRLDLGGRLAIAFAMGGLTIATLLFMATLARIPWTRAGVYVAVIAIAAGAVWRVRLKSERAIGGGAALLILPLAITTYGVLSARETCADLLYIWAPKAIRFALVGKVDPFFLGFPHYSLMHADYPPLLTLLFSFATLVAHRFSWWGALLLTPISLLATALAFRAITRDAIGDRLANRYALLLAAMLACGFASGMVGGAADPTLLLYELIAVTALTFAPDDRGARLLAALCLGAAVFTKVEGALFAFVTVGAFVVCNRRLWLRALAMSIPTIVFFGSWFLWARHYGLLDIYGWGKNPLHPEVARTVFTGTLRQAGYEAAYLPWIAPLVLLGFGRNFRRAALPLLVAIGSIGYVLFFYFHSPDPQWWIASSAMRVLLTPVACLAVASAAASE
ncbi:MAG TPA: hypothetical protein VN605_04220 [Thermoanaerobaculia bacterium]|nr:hypothetical protein [Thermoanaerobaculia bacterium]